MFLCFLLKHLEVCYWKLTSNTYQDIKGMNHSDLPEQRQTFALFFFFSIIVSKEFSLFTSELDYRHIEKLLKASCKLKHDYSIKSPS